MTTKTKASGNKVKAAKKAPRARAKKAPVKKAAPSKAKKARRPAAKASTSSRGKYLVIVESPAKARTLERYLGSEFNVLASVGHVIDLPVSSLGVDVDNDFAPQYETIKGKKAIVENLKRQARMAKRVYLAPDPDREGEAIAYHIAQAIGNGNTEIHRAVFHEVTKSAVLDAIENPSDINTNLFNAQQARRILDRLVGYKISPLLWKKVRRGLSAGRVQSVALRLICDREKEIRIFKPVEYWTVGGKASASSPPPFHLRLAKIDGKPAEVHNQTESDGIIDEVRGQPFVVSKVIKREAKKRPFAPFITSTLQQEAARKLRMTAQRTMRLAQRLYEGIEFGDSG
ncbi:type I DNA topoisomerase, partial [Candidatus Sumerlaeota bacterium]|nr:type I DNA topoisomerase [Candidatus Sumerlaeota bacterium]